MTHGCCCQIFQERFGPLSLSGQTLCTAMAHRTQQAGIDSCQPCQRPGIQLIIFPTTLTDKSHVYADNSVHTKGVCLSRLGGRLRRTITKWGDGPVRPEYLRDLRHVTSEIGTSCISARN